MVGVPQGRPGCATCKRRKVRCDLKKPECQRCIVYGVKCEGYQNGPSIILHTQQELAKKAKQDETKSRKRTATLKAKGKQTETVVQRFEHLEFVNESPDNVKALAKTQKAMTNIPKTIDSARLAEMFYLEAFYRTYMPDSTAAESSTQRWLDVSLRLSEVSSNSTLELSLRALALVRVARMWDNKHLMVAGRSTYVNALNSLQKSLWDKEQSSTDEILAATRCLCTYEIYESTPASIRSGWHKHIDGLERLIANRGVESLKKMENCELLDGARLVSMVKALSLCQKSPLGTKEMSKLPCWRDEEPYESSMLEIGFELSEAIAEANALLKRKDDYWIEPEVFESFLSRFCAIDERFREWEADMGACIEHCYEPASDSPPTSDTDDVVKKQSTPPKPVLSYKYKDWRTGYAMIFNWALRLICALASTELEAMTTKPEEPRLPVRIEHANSIIRSLNFLMAPEMGTMGPQRCLFPYSLALACYSWLGARPEVEADCDRGLQLYSVFRDKLGMMVMDKFQVLEAYARVVVFKLG